MSPMNADSRPNNANTEGYRPFLIHYTTGHSGILKITAWECVVLVLERRCRKLDKYEASPARTYLAAAFYFWIIDRPLVSDPGLILVTPVASWSLPQF